jgi:phospholipid/cholesterol/gamma-HCH transport system substrate-binding protein
MRNLLAPLVALVTGAVLLVGGNQLLFPNGGGYLVRAEFADASGLSKDSAVKIGGVGGGIVDSIALTRRDTALVTMTLDHGAAPIGAGATAAIRPVNLLGENYVDLAPGNLKRPEASGTRIPLARTSHGIALDDVLATLDPDTRLRLRVLINEAGVALDGHGADFNALLAQLPPSLSQAEALLAGLGANNHVLQELISRSDRVVTAMNGKAPDLQQLVDHAATTLQAVADRRAQLGATVQAAPAALVQAHTTFTQLGAAATQLQPLGTAIQAAAPALAATLIALPSFTGDAKPALASIAQNAPQLQRLSAGALAPVRALAPVAGRLDSVARQSGAVSTALDSGNVFRDVLRLVYGWARTIQQRDGLGHIFGLRLTLNVRDLQSALERLLKLHPSERPAQRARPPAATGPAPVSAGVPAPSPPAQPKPTNAGSTLQQLLGSASSAVNRTLSALAPPVQSTVQQLQGLLHYLTGR